MCESIVVVGAAFSADVDAPTERVHSAPGARRGQSPEQPTGRTKPLGEDYVLSVMDGWIRMAREAGIRQLTALIVTIAATTAP